MGRVYALILFSAVLGGSLGYGIKSLGLLQINDIQIEVNSAQQEYEKLPVGKDNLISRVRALSQPYLGKKFWDVSLPGLRDHLLEDGWIQEASLSRTFPGRLVIQLEPVKIVGFLLTKAGHFRPISIEGKVLSVVKSKAIPDAPLFRGAVFEKDPTRVKGAVEILKGLPPDGHFKSDNISDISYASDTGYILNLIQPRVEIYLGEEGFNTKLTRISQIVEYLSINQLRGRVIDASFGKKVLVRLRKGS